MWQSKADLPLLQTRTPRPERGRARPRAPLPGSSFNSVGQVSPSARWFTREGDGRPPSHIATPSSFGGSGGLLLVFSMCVADLSPGGRPVGAVPPGTAAGTASTSQGAFGERRALSGGLGGHSLHHQKGPSRTIFTPPQGWLCALQAACTVFLNSHTDLMRLEFSVMFREETETQRGQVTCPQSHSTESGRPVQASWTRVASRLLECRRGNQQGPVKDAGLLPGAQGRSRQVSTAAQSRSGVCEWGQEGFQEEARLQPTVEGGTGLGWVGRGTVLGVQSPLSLGASSPHDPGPQGPGWGLWQTVLPGRYGAGP